MDPDRLGPVPAAAVRRAVITVLDGEETGPAEVNVSFLSSAKMRGLNRRTFGRDRSTDVIALEFSHPHHVIGDVYICPATARRLVGPDIPESEEIIRLVVHGTLHVLGYEHPEGRRRTGSSMWRRQERYVRELIESE